MNRTRSLFLFCCLFCFAASASPVIAAEGDYDGVAYVVSVGAEQYFGLRFQQVRQSGLGVYVEGKMAFETKPSPVETFPVQFDTADHTLAVDDGKDFWRSFGTGVTWGLNEKLALYAGAGLSLQYKYDHETWTANADTSVVGDWWRPSVDEDDWKLSLSAGAIYRLGDITTQL